MASEQKTTGLPEHIPAHIAIIMDGNGRWAKQRGQKRSFGHQAGAETVHVIAEEAARLAIRSPLLDNVNIMNAKGVLINITGGADVTLRETEVITDVVNQIVDLDTHAFYYSHQR